MGQQHHATDVSNLQVLQKQGVFMDSSSNSNGGANNKEDSLHIDMGTE